jgi:hypothetical protein
MYVFNYHINFYLSYLPLSQGLAVNFLLIESLQRFHQYYGDDLQVFYCLLSVSATSSSCRLNIGGMSDRQWRLHEPCRCR